MEASESYRELCFEIVKCCYSWHSVSKNLLGDVIFLPSLPEVCLAIGKMAIRTGGMEKRLIGTISVGERSEPFINKTLPPFFSFKLSPREVERDLCKYITL